MITQETIDTLARKYQTEDANVWREYFQHVFLSYFYRQPGTDKVYFKGGTALRLLYRSPRFSEDLDFSSSVKDVKIIEDAVVGALVEIEREGIKGELDEAKSTSGGYLATMRFRANGSFVPTRIEISFRNGKEDSEVASIEGDFIPPYTVVQLSQEQIVEGKMQALLTRKKPRDFYDLYFLLRANLVGEKSKEKLQAALDALHGTHIRFDRELKRFLPKSHWPIIREFPDALEREIKRYV
ncbi:MAG TPA: nucleotidyl transferase AbiEii/AbiGii toxin family protein [Candidatus Paceibacterota bacterium]